MPQQIECGTLLTEGPLNADEIASRLDEVGMVRMVDALSPDELASAQEEIADYVSRHGTSDHDLLDLAAWESPTLQRIATSERVERLLNTVAGWQSGASPSEQGGYSRRVLRIHAGTGVLKTNPYVWHYDASTVTMHIPILIPGGDTGNLAAFPDHRPRRRTATTSLREKIQPQDQWAARTFAADPARYTVDLIPGDAYVFRGYRTLHTGLPWPPGQLRANLLLHYGYPKWAESGALRTAHIIRQGIRRMRGQQLNAD
jgi:hypothetical protein